MTEAVATPMSEEQELAEALASAPESVRNLLQTRDKLKASVVAVGDHAKNSQDMAGLILAVELVIAAMAFDDSFVAFIKEAIELAEEPSE